MAFSGGLGDRNDDRRFRGTQSPRDETFPSLTSPLRSIGSKMAAPANTMNDARGSLVRRFTTNTVPTLPTLSPLSPIGQQRRQAAEQLDYNAATLHKVQLLEKKRLEYEFVREQRRRFEAEMELLDRQQRNQEDELHQLANDLSRTGLSGRQSEPTTPPELRDNGFPNAFSKPNRYSTGLISPPGLPGHSNRSGSHLTSPQHSQGQSISHMPSKSMPGSRRNSDEEDDDEYDEYELTPPVHHQSARALNRNSMPVIGYDRRFANNDLPDVSSVLGQIDPTKYLFDDTEDRPSTQQTSMTSPEGASFFHMNTTDDRNNFPVLIRRGGDNTMQYTASSAALDLATDPSPALEAPSNGFSSFSSRHRQSQHSLPHNMLCNQAEEHDLAAAMEHMLETPSRAGTNNRRSMEVGSKFSPFGSGSKRSSLQALPSNGTNGMPKLQSSFSTNDIPTVKNPNGASGTATPNGPNTHAEQHFHNHNASLGRIPPGAVNNRHSRELSGAENRIDEQKGPYRAMNSALHASAAPFGPSLGAVQANQQAVNANMQQNVVPQFPPAFYGGYNMNMNMILQNQQMAQWGNAMAPMYQNAFQQYGPTYPPFNGGGNRFPDSQTRIVQNRRAANGQDQARFQDFDLATMRKDILQLCKDQYGCRFLQKKLEELNEEYTLAIFEETKDAVIDLMTDPFGNYLCQKLLEFTNDDQRTTLMKNAAPQMVTIALNQHGTRALQKMIEYIVTPEQISTIIEALQSNVVVLIQDLNGNHVIQKCLNHLKAPDAQFIFSAVGLHCVVVGTHRHGCCVLQRCIDHASGEQRNTLIDQITQSSYDLVQDPFGNYVVQYILDLNDPRFTHPLCANYVGKVIELSKQKFSSNVMEKCIRVAPMDVKTLLIEELLTPGELENLMRDPYANYVIQTALDFADNDTSLRLIEAIKPLLPSVRQTPYGRRIQTKLSEREARLMQGNGPAMIDPISLAASPISSPLQAQVLPYNANAQMPSAGYGAGPNGFPHHSIAAPQPHRMSNPPLPAHLQNSVQQSAGFGRSPNSPHGFNYF